VQFLDYNRTIVGYHGTRRSVALEIVQRKRTYQPSTNDDDWLGHGIYFWEHAPRQALWWAKRRQAKQGWTEEVAVLGSMIRLGNCLDLLDPRNTEYLEEIFARYKEDMDSIGQPLPKNYNTRKYLDCRVFEYAYALIESELGGKVDSSRAVYVPTGKDKQGRDKRVWERSWIVREAHIQVCVRNPACILGTWLETLPEPAGPEAPNNGQAPNHEDDKDPSTGGETT
jgi:hypothetical protein